MRLRRTAGHDNDSQRTLEIVILSEAKDLLFSWPEEAQKQVLRFAQDDKHQSLDLSFASEFRHRQYSVMGAANCPKAPRQRLDHLQRSQQRAGLGFLLAVIRFLRQPGLPGAFFRGKHGKIDFIALGYAGGLLRQL